MKRFTLIFSFITALLFGATVSAQMMPGGSLQILIYSHTSVPLVYGNGACLAKNELIRMLTYVAASEEECVALDSGTVPFYMNRSGEFVLSEGFNGRLLASPTNESWAIQGNKGEFYSREYSVGSTQVYRNITSCMYQISTSQFDYDEYAFGYAVFYNTSKNLIAGNVYGCPGSFDGIGKNAYLSGYRIIPLGCLPVGANEMMTIGPAQYKKFLSDADTVSAEVRADFEACKLADLLNGSSYICSSKYTESAPAFPASVDVRQLAPQISANASDADGCFELVLPGVAQGIMRYTVYTTTDLSKPFGEWSLLDEVLKTSEAKKVLANESGMSYTLIRVEDHAAPTIVLPKIGEKRFYRVVGE